MAEDLADHLGLRDGGNDPLERTRWTRGSSTSADSFSSSSNGESVMPVVPSDHGFVEGVQARKKTMIEDPERLEVLRTRDGIVLVHGVFSSGMSA
jgi:hypothetical protein